MSYAGDVSPAQAYAAVTGSGGPVLVDVRTHAEWTYVGVPQLGAGRSPLLIEWQRYPDGSVNDAFVGELREAGVTEGTPLYFLCRSGARSVAAARTATAAGLGPAYNVLEGFEGPPGPDRRRTVGGWKAAGLPWTQG